MVERVRLRPAAAGLRRDSLRFRLGRRAKTGGKGIRTPDIQLAKLALYQLSYAPARTAECRWTIVDCKLKSSCFPAKKKRNSVGNVEQRRTGDRRSLGGRDAALRRPERLSRSRCQI